MSLLHNALSGSAESKTVWRAFIHGGALTMPPGSDISVTMSSSRRTFALFTATAALMALVLWSCYPKPVGSVGPEGKKLTWKQMNKEQRKAHMRSEVLPRAAAIFRDWRPERFGSVDCSLCHGQGAAAGIFDMPTDHLPRLSGDLFLGPEFEKHPDTTRLKLNRLVPEMSDALGVKKFSLITRRGFGCYSCHLGPTGPLFGN
jgi:hypothetical protein